MWTRDGPDLSQLANCVLMYEVPELTLHEPGERAAEELIAPDDWLAPCLIHIMACGAQGMLWA